MHRVYIVDDHPIVREGLRNIIDHLDGFEVTGEAGCCDELIECIERDSFDLLLIDISMPGVNTMDVIKMLHGSYPYIRVLVISMLSEDQYAIPFIKTGAHGFISKSSNPSDIMLAMQTVMKGDVYLSPSMNNKMLYEMNRPEQRMPHKRLSPREFQVFSRLAHGLSLKDIGEELSLSIKTVSTHKVNLMKKMKFNSNADLIDYAIINDFLTK